MGTNAVALNHATNVTVNGNELTGNYFGISSVGTGGLQLGDNRIATAPGGIARKIR